MPPNKKRKLAIEGIELACEFSECTDKCVGMKKLDSHVTLHINLMREQLSAGSLSGTDDNVDSNQCECPWRDCQVILNIADNWDFCLRHIYYHAFHTHLKALGDEELRWRALGNLCSKDPSQRNTLPELPDPLVCRWASCEYHTNNPWIFYCHVNGHALEAPSGNKVLRRCHWSSCEYSIKSSITKMKEHLRSHTQEKTHACSRCGVMVSMSTRLEDHVNRQATGEHGFECSHCSKKYASARLLRDHLRKHVNMYGCMFCEMSCPSPSALRIHILYRHSTERPYGCTECDLTFKTKFDYNKHTLIHQFKGQKFSCVVEHCGFTCHSVANLQRHNFSVHEDGGRIFGCHICSRGYVNSRELSEHLKQEHSLKYPAGHVKFRFTPDVDGVRRLVTMRYECLSNEEDATELNQEFASTGDELAPVVATSSHGNLCENVSTHLDTAISAYPPSTISCDEPNPSYTTLSNATMSYAMRTVDNADVYAATTVSDETVAVSESTNVTLTNNGVYLGQYSLD